MWLHDWTKQASRTRSPVDTNTEERLKSLETRVGVLSKAVAMAMLREVDLLRRLNLPVDNVVHDSTEILTLLRGSARENKTY